MSSRRNRERRKKDRRNGGDPTSWSGVDRRKEDRREDWDYAKLDVATVENYESKKQLKLDRREKERRLQEKRKMQRLKKELGFHQ